MRVRVELAHTLDAEEWAAQHAAGVVPDRWPYGLDRLGELGVDVSVRRPSNRFPTATRLIGGALRRATGLELLDALRPRRGADTVLAWDERPGFPAAALSGVPVMSGVIWATEPNGVLPAARPIVKRALRRARVLWCLSAPQTQLLVEMGASQDQVHWLPFGVDVDFWSPFGEPEGALVASVGNDRHRDWSTVLKATDGMNRLAVTRALPPGEGVVSRLTHAELRGLYGRASVVAIGLQPNTHVSGITSALEAMACGRPIVISDTMGMSDYVVHGETGILVPPGDPEAMRREISSLLADPARAAEIGAAARRAVLAEFSTTRMCEHLVRLTQEL